MSSKTNFLNLKKPDSLDYYDIEDFNNNADIIDKKAQELANNADTDRKRVDNLLQSNTVDTQEIGKVILTTSQTEIPHIMDYLAANVVYYELFSNINSKDLDFLTISYSSSSSYCSVKLLKVGLYHIKFRAKIWQYGGLPEIPMRIVLQCCNSLDGDYADLKTEYLVFSKTSSETNMRNVEFIFSITEPTYIRLAVTNMAEDSDSSTFTFYASDCAITVLDWIGKKSGAASETADIRLGADGQTYKTAGESVRKQFENASNERSELKEFCRENTENLSEYILGTPNLALLSKLKSKDGFVVYQVASERNKVFIVNQSAKVGFNCTLASLTVYKKSQYYTDNERLIIGSKYIIFGVTSDVTIKFLNENGGTIDTVFCNYTVQDFAIPEGCTKLEIYIDSSDSEIFLDVFICKYREKTMQQQIDSLNDKIDAMQQIITQLVTAPALTADESGNLQISENEEG